MTISLPSQAVTNATLRHVGTAAGTAITIFATLGFLDPANASAAIDAVHQMMNGLQQAFGGFYKLALVLGPAIGAMTTWFAGTSSTMKALLQRVAKADEKGEIKVEGKIVAPADVAVAVPSDKVVAKALIVALALGLLAGPALAQGKRTATPIPIPCDPANLLPGCQQASPVPGVKGKLTLQQLLSKPLQDLANFINNDFSGAAALAISIPDMQDGNGQACWSLMMKAKGVFNNETNPGPNTAVGAAILLEQVRLISMLANRICNDSHCTQVFTEAGNTLNAIAPIPALPNLTDLCSKVPSIAQVASTPVPTDTSTPTSTPSASPTPAPSASPAQ